MGERHRGKDNVYEQNEQVDFWREKIPVELNLVIIRSKVCDKLHTFCQLMSFTYTATGNELGYMFK